MYGAKKELQKVIQCLKGRLEGIQGYNKAALMLVGTVPGIIAQAKECFKKYSQCM